MWSGAWPSLAITNLQRSLATLRALVEYPPADQPDDVTRALSAHLVIRASGYLEQVVVECLRAYAQAKSIDRVATYAVGWISNGLNPSPSKLEAFVRRMDGDWAEEIKLLLDDDDQRLRREIAGLVDRRNKLAHGLAEGISARKALSMTDDALALADWFVTRYDPR